MFNLIALGVDWNSFVFGIKYSPADEDCEEDEVPVSVLFICIGPFFVSVIWDKENE